MWTSSTDYEQSEWLYLCTTLHSSRLGQYRQLLYNAYSESLRFTRYKVCQTNEIHWSNINPLNNGLFTMRSLLYLISFNKIGTDKNALPLLLMMICNKVFVTKYSFQQHEHQCKSYNFNKNLMKRLYFTITQLMHDFRMLLFAVFLEHYRDSWWSE